MSVKVALLVMGCELTAAFVGSFVGSTGTSLAARRPATRCLSVGNKMARSYFSDSVCVLSLAPSLPPLPLSRTI
jgi:hypothetical protein